MPGFFTAIYDVLGVVFGPIMSAIFEIVRNYGLSIIIFTVICRIFMLPFAVNQHNNMAKNHRMQMKLRKITEKHKNDKQRQQQETQEFYRREGYNPMKAGCSTGMILQMPIMFGIIAAIYRPLSYTVRVPGEYITRLSHAMVEILSGEGGGLLSGGGAMLRHDSPQIQLRVTENIEQLAHMFGEGADLINPHWFEAIKEFTENFTMFGLQLGVTPQEAVSGGGSWVYYLVPVFVALSQLSVSAFTFLRQRKTNPEQNQNAMMMGCMTFGMPLFTAWIALTFPVGAGVYWIISSLVAFVQTVALTYLIPPQKMLARVLVEETVQRRSRENSKKKIAEYID